MFQMIFPFHSEFGEFLKIRGSWILRGWVVMVGFPTGDGIGQQQAQDKICLEDAW